VFFSCFITPVHYGVGIDGVLIDCTDRMPASALAMRYVDPGTGV
jgi:hypothetical protein